MASSSDQIFGITTIQAIVPIGATAAILTPDFAYVKSLTMKYSSGGSITLFGCPIGATSALADMVTGYSNGYLLATTEVISFAGPARFYIAATGATAAVSLLYGLSSGYTPGT